MPQPLSPSLVSPLTLLKLSWLTEAASRRAISAVFTGPVQSFLSLLLPLVLVDWWPTDHEEKGDPMECLREIMHSEVFIFEARKMEIFTHRMYICVWGGGLTVLVC